MKLQSVFILIITFTLLFSQHEHKKGGEKARILMKWKMTEFLDLDEEQAEKFFPKFNSYHKDHKQKDSEIKKIFDEVQLMVNKEEVNQKKIENLIEDIYDLEISKDAIHKDFMLSIDKVLSAEQQARLVIFKHIFKKRMKEEVPHFKGNFKRERRGKKNRF